MALGFRNVTLKPTPFACIKSSILSDSFYSPRSHPKPPTGNAFLEPSGNGIAIPKGLKVFVNIAFDVNVPAPPEGSEEAIQKAMQGEELDELNPEGWYVPTIVSDGRQDTDKGGKLSLVFDAVFNKSLKSRALKDPEFKTFLIELAFQRIEAQTSGTILLSRQIGTPNIASKGKLEPRTVQIPNALFPEGDSVNEPKAKSGPGKKPLIEEVEENPKGILKSPTSKYPMPSAPSTPIIPSWSWIKSNAKIKLTVLVPKLTHDLIPRSTLDLEPRRIILSIPDLYLLDINLDASDAELMATFSKSEHDSAFSNAEFNNGNGEEKSLVDSALTLKRVRDLDVEGAKAEWRVGEGILIINA